MTNLNRGMRRANDPMLIVFGGLPGTGKTTISRAVADRCFATYLRIDAIEHVFQSTTGTHDIGAVGYEVAQALAASYLTIGRILVVNCVSPVTAWRLIAGRANAAFVEVEIICSDPIEHRLRVKQRRSDIDGSTC